MPIANHPASVWTQRRKIDWLSWLFCIHEARLSVKKVRTGGEWLDYIVQNFVHLNKSRGKNVIYLFFICLFCLSPSCPTLSGLCSPVVGLFMCSWEEVIYVSAADLWQFLSASQFMQQRAKHHCFISFSEYTLSPSLSLWRS